MSSRPDPQAAPTLLPCTCRSGEEPYCSRHTPLPGEADLVIEELLAIEKAAKSVVDLYPTVAGTVILIRNANRHVSRTPWDEVAEAIYALAQTLKSAHDD